MVVYRGGVSSWDLSPLGKVPTLILKEEKILECSVGDGIEAIVSLTKNCFHSIL